MEPYPDNNNQQYAKKVCDGEKKARNKFFLTYSDKTYWVAKKWYGPVKNYNKIDSYLLSGESILTTDDIQDTMVWLLDKIIKATCKYKGNREAKLDTYIISILNGRFTFNDWLKKKYGDTEYIPNIIKNLPVEHQQIYILLKRKSDLNTIQTKIDLSRDEIQNIILEIKYILYKNGKGHTLGKNKIETIDITDNEGQIKEIDQFQDITNVDPADIIEFQKVYTVIKGAYKKLSTPDKRLIKLYWSQGMKVSNILLYIENEKNLNDFNNIKINNEKDLYKYITSICKKCNDWIKSNDKQFYESYELTISKIKKSLKVIINDFE